MADSGAALLTGGLFSLAVAGVSGLVAYYTARANSRAGLAASRANLEGEIRKISEQVEAQEAARERGELATLRQSYLTPLRYYASALSRRLAELEAKFSSAEDRWCGAGSAPSRTRSAGTTHGPTSSPGATTRASSR